MKRSDGQKGTVWVNNKPMQEDSANGEVEVGKLGRDGNEVKLKVPTTGKGFNLKAGQVYLPQSGSISELNTHNSHATNKKAGGLSEVISPKPENANALDTVQNK